MKYTTQHVYLDDEILTSSGESVIEVAIQNSDPVFIGMADKIRNSQAYKDFILTASLSSLLMTPQMVTESLTTVAFIWGYLACLEAHKKGPREKVN